MAILQFISVFMFLIHAYLQGNPNLYSDKNHHADDDVDSMVIHILQNHLQHVIARIVFS